MILLKAIFLLKRSLLLLAALVSFPSLVFSQSKLDPSSSLMEAKVQIENSISNKLKNTIGTTLEKETFEVSVHAELSEVPQRKFTPITRTNRDKKPLDPGDLSLGLIDAESLIQNYESQIDELRIRNEVITQRILQESQVKKEYSIKSLSIQVGILEAFGTEYVQTFTDWLNKTTKKDFGNLPVNVEVSLIKLKPELPKQEPKFFDYVSQLQILIAALLAFFGLLLAIFISKRMVSQDALEERNLKAQLQQQINETQNQPILSPAPDILEELLPPPPQVRQLGSVELEMLKDSYHKVVWTLNHNRDHLKDVVNLWLETGERGRLKAASLMDVMVSQNKNLGETVQPIVNWAELVPESFKKEMKIIFDRMSEFSFEDRVKILEEIYWDMMSLKTLGANYLQQPFDFVANLPVKDVEKVLLGQSPQIKALTVLYMPDTKREEFFSKSSFESKKELVEQALNMGDVLVTDLETASESLKFEVKKKAPSSDVVSIKSLVPKFFASMSPLDEITLLKDVLPRISDNGRSLKTSFPSLAFLHEWPEDMAQIIFSLATADEVLALLRVIPEYQDKILKLCPPRLKAIVSDDIGIEDKTDNKEKNKHLTSLKLKMLKQINKDSIDLERLFSRSDGDKNGGLRVAS